MPETPNYGRYTEIPYDRMTPELAGRLSLADRDPLA